LVLIYVINISSIVSTIIMKLSTVAILLGAAVAAVPGVVSAEVSSCLMMGGVLRKMHLERVCLGAAGGCV